MSSATPSLWTVRFLTLSQLAMFVMICVTQMAHASLVKSHLELTKLCLEFSGRINVVATQLRYEMDERQKLEKQIQALTPPK